MLETVRQYAEEQLAAADTISDARDRHARYFADRADAVLELWASPQQLEAYQWIDSEFANLRAGFGWSASNDDLHSAASIAISTSIVGVWIQRYEQFAWAEELLDSAIHHGVRRLPSLYTAAAHCFLTGRIDDSLRFGRAAVDLNDQPEYDPVPFAYCYLVLGSTYSYAGQLDRNLQTAAACRQRSDDRLTAGPSQLAFGLAVAKRFDEAQTMAEEAVSATTASGIPSQIAFALVAYGRAFAETDPAQALVAMRRGLAVARASDNRWQEAMVGTELAALETAHGDASAALETLRLVIDSQFRAGDVVTLAYSLSNLAVVFDLLGRSEPAATMLGAVARTSPSLLLNECSAAIEHLNQVVGSDEVERHMRVGRTMDRGAATLYALSEIDLARDEQSHGE